MTVKELKEICDRLIADGHGNKICYTPNDDEGNGCHIMWKSVLSDIEDIQDFDEYDQIEKHDNCVIIG